MHLKMSISIGNHTISNNFNLRPTIFFGLFSILILSGCGGSGGGNTASNDNSNTTPTTPDSESLSVDNGLAKLTVGLVDNVILPTYKNMYTRSQQLEIDVNQFCELSEPSEGDFSVLQQSWRDTNASWQGARTIKFGPIADTFYYSRIQFWPISSTKLASDVESFISENNDLSEGFGNYRHQIQGLPAMEHILFNDAGKPLFLAEDKLTRCHFLKAVALNIKEIMNDTIVQWEQGYGQSFKDGSGDFDSKKYAIEKYLTIWFEYLEIINDDKLKSPMGVEPPGKPDLLESPVSKSSLKNIKINMQHLFSQYQGGALFGFDDYLTEVNSRADIDADITEAFELVLAKLDIIDEELLSDLIKTEEGRAKVEAVRGAITQLRTIMSTDFVQVTDLAPGFNTNDGD